MTAAALGEQLLASLPPLPLYSISLHNDRAELLWINEGELGPHEQSLAEEALQFLGAEPEQPSYENVLQDGRAASVIPVRTPRGDLLGLILLITAPTGEPLVEQLLTPQLRTILRKLSVLMRPSIPGASDPTPRGRPQRGRVQADRQAAAPQRRAMPAPEVAPAAAPEAVYEEQYQQQEGYPAEGEYAEEAYAQEAGEAPAEAEQYPQEAYAGEYPQEYAQNAAAPEPQPAPEPPLRQVRFVQRPAQAPRQAAAPAPTARPSAGQRTARAPQRAVQRAPQRAPQRAAVPRQSAPRQRVSSAAPEAAGRVPPGYRRAPQQARPATRPSAAQVRAARAYAASQPAEVPPMRASAAGRRLAEAVQTQQFYPGRGTAAPQRPTRPAVPEPRVLLELLPFVNLRQGARGRRFEVLPHAVGGETVDRLDSTTVQELIGWLGTHRGLWSLEPTSFTVNLSIATLEDERFLPETAQALRAQGIQAETLGFEIAEALYTQNRALVERFVSLCDKTGCFLAIDDFSFDPAVLGLLRSRAVRLVKVDAKLTGALQRDKLSEALVTAIIQATRVLGVQCAAKAVESQSLLQWLTAAGCDVAQGPALSGPQPLEALGALG